MTLLAFLDILVLILHVVVCALLIGIVLIQGGKGASMSATFGMGAAATAFGARTDTFMTKLTSGAAIIFVFTSLALTFLGSRTGSFTQRMTVEPPAAEVAPPAAPVAPAEEPAASPSPAATAPSTPPASGGVGGPSPARSSNNNASGN